MTDGEIFSGLEGVIVTETRLSKVDGTAAHILEQIAEARMIRPRAAYGGELNRVWMPIEERGNGADGAVIGARAPRP